MAATGAAGAAQLRLVRSSSRPLYFIAGEPDHRSPELCGYFHYGATVPGAEARGGWLQDAPGEGIAERLPLSDAEAVEGATFDGWSASTLRNPRFSTMKTAIVLAVAMIERLMPDDVLNLGEVEACPALQQGNAVAVRLTRKLANFIFLSIVLDGMPYGRITVASRPYVEEGSA